MKDIGPIRTALFVPGTRPDRVDKAVATAADMIIIDLEDAVPLDQKTAVRPAVAGKVAEHRDRKIFVRINGLATDFARGDLKTVIVPGLSGIMVPKLETAEQVREIDELLCDAERDQGIALGEIVVLALVESALGVENAFAIASEKTDPDRRFTIAFGAADYTLDLGIELTRTGEELSYPRARIAVACRAAEIAPPIDTPFMIDLKDMEALEADTNRAKQLGFQGKLCIHPNQVEVCNRLFSPTPEEIEFARRVVEAFVAAEAQGSAAIQLDGKFIDYPIVARSRQILKLSESL
jgi:citrate lyase subunit beta / citryl-CoA lyase